MSIDFIPDEMVVHIFQFLHPVDLFISQRICRRFKRIITGLFPELCKKEMLLKDNETCTDYQQHYVQHSCSILRKIVRDISF